MADILNVGLKYSDGFQTKRAGTTLSLAISTIALGGTSAVRNTSLCSVSPTNSEVFVTLTSNRFGIPDA